MHTGNDAGDSDMFSAGSRRCYVYILHCGDGTLYTGWTYDLQERLIKHQQGTGAKYTRGRGPFTVVYTEECADMSGALKREMAIKSLKRMQKMELIYNYQKIVGSKA